MQTTQHGKRALMRRLVHQARATGQKVLVIRPVGEHLHLLGLLAEFFDAKKAGSSERMARYGRALELEFCPDYPPVTDCSVIANAALAHYAAHAVFPPNDQQQKPKVLPRAVRFFHYAETHEHAWIEVDLEGGRTWEYVRSGFGLVECGTFERLRKLAQYVVDEKLADNWDIHLPEIR